MDKLMDSTLEKRLLYWTACAVKYTGDMSYQQKITYKGYADDYVTEYSVGIFTVNPQRDLDGRYTGRTVTLGGTEVDTEAVTYLKNGAHATTLPPITFADGSDLSYTYDDNGNITQIKQSGILQARYTYDTLNRLVREDNLPFNRSTVFAYDNNGNILSKKISAYTTGTQSSYSTVTYAYNSLGRMTGYNGGTCTYDGVGNPVTYLGKTLTWTRGRKLVAYDGTTFEYDGYGRRTKKNDITYVCDSQGRILKQSDGITYFYVGDELLGLYYSGLYYAYRKDLQGNIIALINSTGTVVAKYSYDAWGNCTVTDADGNVQTSGIGVINPIRYRGYYYDVETGLYFLKTRYYDPTTCRFLNMDGIDYADPETINGLNLYAYCNNNPVMNTDPEGTFLLGLLIGVVVGAAIGFGVRGLTYKEIEEIIFELFGR